MARTNTTTTTRNTTGTVKFQRTRPTEAGRWVIAIRKLTDTSQDSKGAIIGYATTTYADRDQARNAARTIPEIDWETVGYNTFKNPAEQVVAPVRATKTANVTKKTEPVKAEVPANVVSFREAHARVETASQSVDKAALQVRLETLTQAMVQMAREVGELHSLIAAQ